MASINVTFSFHSGIKRTLFQNVRLSGSWDAAESLPRNGHRRRCCQRRMEQAATPSA